VDKIRPKVDTKDYYGNLPIHYTIAKDDHQMILNYFTNGKIYFDLRNYKYESIFHIAGKNNSILSIKALVQKSLFQEELLKRDFKGDTPLHSAAKAGSIDVLSFYLTACTPKFLELENDFGMTPLVALQEKVSMIREKVADKEMTSQEKDKFYRKMEKLLAVQVFLQDFDDFIN
jgi:ankyrin repeat protein